MKWRKIIKTIGDNPEKREIHGIDNTAFDYPVFGYPAVDEVIEQVVSVTDHLIKVSDRIIKVTEQFSSIIDSILMNMSEDMNGTGEEMDCIVEENVVDGSEKTEMNDSTEEPTDPIDPNNPTNPIINIDGKTEDGSMPYNLLKKQLELLK